MPTYLFLHYTSGREKTATYTTTTPLEYGVSFRYHDRWWRVDSIEWNHGDPNDGTVHASPTNSLG